MSTPCDNIGGCQCRHKQAVPNTMQFVVRADCIVHFRRKYLKGLLSIPSHGRGARPPLGQSFRESVGPAWELTPHVSFVHALQGEVARVPMKYSCPTESVRSFQVPATPGT